MDVELGIVFEAREGATEVAAAPIGFLRDFRGDLLCQLRIVGKDDHARTLVPQRQAAIVICGSGFAGLDVHSTGDGIGAESFRRTRIDEDGGLVAIKDVGKAVEIPPLTTIPLPLVTSREPCWPTVNTLYSSHGGRDCNGVDSS